MKGNKLRKKYIKCSSNLDDTDVDEFVKEIKKSIRQADKDASNATSTDYMDKEQAEAYYEGKYTGLQGALEILSKFTGEWYL